MLGRDNLLIVVCACKAARGFPALFFCLALLSSNIARAAQEESDTQRMLRLLDWLSVTECVQQLGRVVEQNIDQLAGALTLAQREKIRVKISKYSHIDTLLGDVSAHITKSYTVDFPALEAFLLQPLMVRARNFDAALAMGGARENFLNFQRQLSTNPPSEQRLRLVERLDQALKTSAFAALLQTEIARAVSLLAVVVVDQTAAYLPETLAAYQQRERANYLSEVAKRLHLYSYRFMEDSELQQYVGLVEGSQIQALLDASYRGLQQALVNIRVDSLQ